MGRRVGMSDRINSRSGIRSPAHAAAVKRTGTDMISIQTNEAIGERGIIDIHLPAGAELVPFVLGIHGGGWRNGDRTSFHWVAQRLLPHGLPVVTCSYRYFPTACFPAAYDDLVALLRWLRRHAGEHGLAPRCALLGSSAGGHLAALLITRALREHRDLIDIAAAVIYCPPTDLELQHQTDAQKGGAMTSNFIGGSPDQQPQAYRAASPLHHVHAAMPPVWMAHGDVDPVVCIEHSRRFVQRLEQAGVPCTFHVAVGREHTMCKADTPETVLLEEPSVVSFLRHHLLESALT